MNGNAATQDILGYQGTLSPPADWAMPPNMWFGPDPTMAPSQYTGSNLGVPGAADAEPAHSTSNAASVAGYAQSVSSRSVWEQPLLWAVVFIAIAVIGLGHLAHVEVRG